MQLQGAGGGWKGVVKDTTGQTKDNVNHFGCEEMVNYLDGFKYFV